MATEARESFTVGSSRLEDFYAWMDKRHRIYLDRKAGKPKPWIDDPILQQYKFTNVFRELDPGTLALRRMEAQYTRNYLNWQNGKSAWPELASLIVFNTWWWRIWNWHEHGPNLGFVTDYQQLYDYMMKLHHEGGRMWTSAHMVRGDGGEQKVYTYLRMMRNVWEFRSGITARIIGGGTIQAAFDAVLEMPLIGDFTAYEIASDLRWSLLGNPPDKYTWGNPGNGAIRGMRRLGLQPTTETMRWLWLSAPGKFYKINSPLLDHFPVRYQPVHDSWEIFEQEPHHQATWPPFEIREIEHCLCEFDKYERARLGQGKPRQKFNGV